MKKKPKKAKKSVPLSTTQIISFTSMVRKKNINQLWRWDTLEDVDINNTKNEVNRS